MLTSIALTILLPVISALPSVPTASVLTSHVDLRERLPTGRTVSSRADFDEVGRMAAAINSAYCLTDERLHPEPEKSFINQVGLKRSQSNHVKERSLISSSVQSNILISSRNDLRYLEDRDVGGDMNWYVSHNPSTQTLTAVFSSLPTTEEFLELLASEPPNNDRQITTLVPISNLLPIFKHLPSDSYPSKDEPKIFHSYVNSIKSHGNSALSAILEQVENPPSSPPSYLSPMARYLGLPYPGISENPIKKIEIIGHGLGSAVGLLVSLALKLELEASTASQKSVLELEITSNLLGLPRIGNEHFARLVDDLIDSSSSSSSAALVGRGDGRKSISLNVNRIVSQYDTIPHLPPKHLGLIHYSKNEIWIDQPDSSSIYYCKSSSPEKGAAVGSEGMNTEDDLCSNGIKLGKTNLEDHLGPYGGVWIDTRCSHRK